MKLLKRLALTIVVLLIVVVASVYGISSYRLGQHVAVNDPPLALVSDSAAIANGEYLVRAITKCADCHGADLGGQMMIDNPAIGRFYAPNLTRGRGSVTAALCSAYSAYGVVPIACRGERVLNGPRPVRTSMEGVSDLGMR